MTKALEDLELRFLESAVGYIDGNEVKAAIDAAMAQGIWTDAFTDAVNSGDLRSEDAQRILVSAARELGIPEPDPEAARRRILRRYASDIALGAVNPRIGLHRIVDRLFGPFTDLYGLGPLIRCWWQIEELSYVAADQLLVGNAAGKTRDQAMSDLEKEIISFAREWLEAHPQ